MKTNISFKFPSVDEIDGIRQMSNLKDIQTHLKSLFNKEHPLMLYPLSDFLKEKIKGTNNFLLLPSNL